MSETAFQKLKFTLICSVRNFLNFSYVYVHENHGKYKRSSDSLVVDFLIKIARRYFFFFAYIKLLILSALGYGSTADILQHAYRGI